MINTPWQVYEITSGKTERAFETEAEAEDFRFGLDDDGGVYDVRMYVLPTLKDRIIEMMTEETGINMLDSGGANGRRWQRNRLIKEWDVTPVIDMDVCSDDCVIIGYSTYHYLMNFLSITEDSERLNDVLKEIIADSDEPIYADIAEFLAWYDLPDDAPTNTYNYDNIIDHVLQYHIIEIDDKPYIILEIHLGADVRGGYTYPQIFALDEVDYFMMAQNDVNASCECADWWSDDGGQNWYLDGTYPSPDTDWKFDEDTNTVTCNKCKKPVEFYVMESC